MTLLDLNLASESAIYNPLVVRFGRSPDCEVVLTDDSVSGLHAELVLERGAIVLRDLQSRNGTFVDGVRIDDSATLAGYRSVRFGRAELPWNHVAVVRLLSSIPAPTVVMSEDEVVRELGALAPRGVPVTARPDVGAPHARHPSIPNENRSSGAGHALDARRPTIEEPHGHPRPTSGISAGPFAAAGGLVGGAFAFLAIVLFAFDQVLLAVLAMLVAIALGGAVLVYALARVGSSTSAVAVSPPRTSARQSDRAIFDFNTGGDSGLDSVTHAELRAVLHSLRAWRTAAGWVEATYRDSLVRHLRSAIPHLPIRAELRHFEQKIDVVAGSVAIELKVVGMGKGEEDRAVGQLGEYVRTWREGPIVVVYVDAADRTWSAGRVARRVIELHGQGHAVYLVGAGRTRSYR